MTAPAIPLQVVASEPAGWCDPETGVCHLREDTRPTGTPVDDQVSAS